MDQQISTPDVSGTRRDIPVLIDQRATYRPVEGKPVYTVPVEGGSNDEDDSHD